MLKFLTLIISFIGIVSTAIAEEIPFKIEDFVENIKDVHSVSVQIDKDDEKTNMYWHLSLPQRYILAEKLATIDKFANLDSSQFLPYKDENYKGVVLQAHTIEGDRYSNLRVFNGQIMNGDGEVIRYDNDRAFELWVLGTTTRVEQKYVIAQTIPIVTFEQCKMLGNQIKNTEPRQCLLTNGDILMEVKGHITEDVLSVNSFDECLLHGQKLIQGFPRKCVAAGGRVFMEQRRKNVGRELKEFIWE